MLNFFLESKWYSIQLIISYLNKEKVNQSTKENSD